VKALFFCQVSKIKIGLERHRGNLAPSLKMPTGHFLNARPGSSPDRATKAAPKAAFVVMEGREVYPP
jgi:hypothetical protein